MEIEEKPNTRRTWQSYTESLSPASSHIHLRDHMPSPKSPEYSPARSSVSSDLSSLSHGVSPARDEAQQSSPEVAPHRVSAAKPPSLSPPPVPVVNRYVREDPVLIKTADPGSVDGFVSVEGEERKGSVGVVGGGDGGRRLRPSTTNIRKTEKVVVMKKAAFGFRVFEFLFCLVSLAVMATDKNKGWALDSYYRYKEFRYCLSVNVIGFVYSGVQGCNLAYQLATGDYISRRRLWYYLDFALDQMLTYLLISASSSAAIRVDDWESNWGKDSFPETARASVGLSFVAFVAFAFSSLISGYAVGSLRSM